MEVGFVFSGDDEFVRGTAMKSGVIAGAFFSGGSARAGLFRGECGSEHGLVLARIFA